MTRRWHITFLDAGDIHISLDSYRLDDALDHRLATNDRVFRRPLIFGFTRMVRRIRKAYS